MMKLPAAICTMVGHSTQSLKVALSLGAAVGAGREPAAATRRCASVSVGVAGAAAGGGAAAVGAAAAGGGDGVAGDGVADAWTAVGAGEALGVRTTAAGVDAAGVSELVVLPALAKPEGDNSRSRWRASPAYCDSGKSLWNDWTSAMSPWSRRRCHSLLSERRRRVVEGRDLDLHATLDLAAVAVIDQIAQRAGVARRAGVGKIDESGQVLRAETIAVL
jgi:hypothetical protein